MSGNPPEPSWQGNFYPREKRMTDLGIRSIEGRAIAVRGTDIDTDRIIPARFLKALTFSELG